MISTTPCASSVRLSTTSAAAPRPSASAMKRCPSVLPPRSAKNTPPCTTWRESVWYVSNVFPTWVPRISPPPVASSSSRSVNLICVSVKREASSTRSWIRPSGAEARIHFGRIPIAMLRVTTLCNRAFFTCEIDDFTGFLVGRNAPVDDDGLGDLLPDGSGGQIAVVQGPIRFAAWVVRLAHDDQHRELWVLGGEEADVRSPDVERVLAVDRNLWRARLFRPVQLQTLDPRGPS